jgi:hypothetical protein
VVVVAVGSGHDGIMQQPSKNRLLDGEIASVASHNLVRSYNVVSSNNTSSNF